jgi:hypothetical protein
MSNVIGENFKHVAFAFLCTKNRDATMREHGCNEWSLFENPIWLLTHYFENSGVELSMNDKKDIFDFVETECGKQIVEAFSCPVNRHAVRAKYKWSDEDFLKEGNKGELVKNFVENGGAVAFALKRKNKKDQAEKIKEKSLAGDYVLVK